MATLPKVSVSCVDLADLFDEERRLLDQASHLNTQQKAEQKLREVQEDYLEQERSILLKERNSLVGKMTVTAEARRLMDELSAQQDAEFSRLEGQLEAVEQLMEELLYGGYAAKLLASERAEQKAR